MSDLEALIQRCQSGDRAAFGELFRSQHARVYRLAVAILRDAHDAEDAVQDIFLRVFKRIGDYRGASAFGTWLTAVAVNVCRDRLRQQKVRRAMSLDWLKGHAGGSDVFNTIADRQARQHLRALVDRLEEKLRLPVILFYQENLSCEEIAYVLGARTSTIYTRLYLARSQLRKMIEEQNAQETDPDLWGTFFVENNG
jgi:RNA polymerase sigma-70 factor (ECF subfamily)